MYCSEAQFSARFGGGELDELIPADSDRSYSAAASDADSLIDSYLAARYAVPLTTVPPLIVGIAADLTRHKLFDKAAPKEVEERAKAAEELLKQLRDGLLTLPSLAGIVGTSPVRVSAADQVFTEDVGSRFVGCL